MSIALKQYKLMLKILSIIKTNYKLDWVLKSYILMQFSYTGRICSFVLGLEGWSALSYKCNSYKHEKAIVTL